MPKHRYVVTDPHQVGQTAIGTTLAGGRYAEVKFEDGVSDLIDGDDSALVDHLDAMPHLDRAPKNAKVEELRKDNRAARIEAEEKAAAEAERIAAAQAELEAAQAVGSLDTPAEVEAAEAGEAVHPAEPVGGEQ